MTERVKERQPVPTRLMAVDVLGGRAIIAQTINGEDVFLMVQADLDWKLEPSDIKNIFQAMRMSNKSLIPVEDESGKDVRYASTEELIEELKQRHYAVAEKIFPDLFRPRTKEEIEKIQRMVKKMQENMAAGKSVNEGLNDPQK